MVQSSSRLDVSFAALSDATRRGVIEQLWCEDASISELAERFQMTLTGMKKHVSVLEQAGLKRGPPSGFSIGYAMFMLPLCFEMTRGTLGRVDGTGGFGAGCTYVIAPISAILLVLAPFNVFGESETPEMTGPSVHHIDASIYALDYSKKSALTGSFAREPSGGFLGNNLG